SPRPPWPSRWALRSRTSRSRSTRTRPWQRGSWRPPSMPTGAPSTSPTAGAEAPAALTSGRVVGVDAHVVGAQVATPGLARRFAGGEADLYGDLVVAQQPRDVVRIEALRVALVEQHALHRDRHPGQVEDRLRAPQRGEDAA